MSSSHCSLPQSTGDSQASDSQASRVDALRGRAYPGRCSDNKVLLIEAGAIRAFLMFKKNENDIYAQPVKAICESLSWRQIEALENIANVYLNFGAKLERGNSLTGKMELYVNTEDYKQLLIFENMLTR
ncbi:hypothetical protein [Endozoicomonas sp. SCSIO W0465]|uniref:hypothetical protein n=1 Tax=Endozoicomonas sp. SCSIO W0465 TaxID=2918516 RepID=UPI0020751715|nr:hypothetical protein [Endozoicomonas sp. SCSIO W0465]USE35788.1 hypothetical protein MJO57_27605 [Endozoicomonas sp. SCSIO W0465]